MRMNVVDMQYTVQAERMELSKQGRLIRRRERAMILVKLIDEPPIRSGGGTSGPDELEGLGRVKVMGGDKVTTHNGDGAASTHRTMNEHACIWT